MEHARASPRRCAVYTRKSSEEEGLEQDFNRSLRSARRARPSSEARRARAGTWLKTGYGGLSGATKMERPALTRLLADIRARLIDVVYKVDRLTR